MKRTGTRFQTEKLMTLLLFVLLAICVVLVLFAGAGVYGRLTVRGQEAFENRTVDMPFPAADVKKHLDKKIENSKVGKK